MTQTASREPKAIASPDIDIIGIWKGYGFIQQRNATYDSRARIRVWRGEVTYVLSGERADSLENGILIVS